VNTQSFKFRRELVNRGHKEWVENLVQGTIRHSGQHEVEDQISSKFRRTVEVQGMAPYMWAITEEVEGAIKRGHTQSVVLTTSKAQPFTIIA